MFVSSKHLQIAIVAASFFGLSAPALAQCNAVVDCNVSTNFDSCSDGSDGAFSLPLFVTEIEIDLSKAVTGDWRTTPGGDQDGDGLGDGVYDPAVWAVVFKYTTIDVHWIDPFTFLTVTFKSHPSGAPVVWLASGDVNIAGTINLDGAGGVPSGDPPPGFSVPPPGGFAGGHRGYGAPTLLSSGGFGPGGAFRRGVTNGGGGGGYATAGIGPSNTGGGGTPYGNEFISPLMGGSGGEAHPTSGGGGTGGGAILIASSGGFVFDGIISANGGRGASTGGSGSGGAVRVISNTISGSGALRALPGANTNANGGGRGGDGWIRVEACTNSLNDLGNPEWTQSTPGFVFSEVIPAVNMPTLTVVSIDGVPVPADPLAGILTSDVSMDNDQNVSVVINATMIPANGGTTVTVRIVPYRGNVVTVTSTGLTSLTDPCDPSSVTVPIPNFPRGRSEIQVKANWDPQISSCP